MEKYVNDFLKEQKEKRPTYRDMIEFCCDNLILNNCIMKETQEKGFFWELYSGRYEYYTDENGEEISESEYYLKEENGEEVHANFIDTYQDYIISGGDAERLGTYTDELIYYCEDLDLYVLCVTHWGTAWSGVPANWKDPEEENEEEREDIE